MLPCLDLCRSNNFHVITQLGVRFHWWVNYSGAPLTQLGVRFHWWSNYPGTPLGFIGGLITPVHPLVSLVV